MKHLGQVPASHKVCSVEWIKEDMMRVPAELKWIVRLGLLACLAIGCSDDHTCTKPTPDNVIRVKPDGAGDYATIQGAIDAADSADVIELADGIYTGAGNRDIDFRGKPITVRSQTGDPLLCVIDCGASASDPHRGFVFDQDEGPSSVLEGITIANAFAPDNGLGEYYGGGIACATTYPPGAIPTIRSCIIRDNAAGTGGGGLYTSGEGGIIENCTFQGNVARAGGGVCIIEGAPILIDCTFIENATVGGSEKNGGAVYAERSPSSEVIIVLNCDFVENSAWYGGAMFMLECRTSVVGCGFRGNTAYSAGGVASYHAVADTVKDCIFKGNSVEQTGGAIDLTVCSGVVIYGCTFTGNFAARAGALAAAHGSPKISQCTLVANSSTQGSGIVSGTGANIIVENTIIADSFPIGGLIACLDAGTANLACCNLFVSFGDAGDAWAGCVGDQYAQNGNISDDPLFCDPEKGDFHLQPESPCSPDSSECGLIGAWDVGCD